LFIKFLKPAGGGNGGSGRSRAGGAETVAEDELFVFAEEVENLEETAAGLFDDGGAGGAGGGVGGDDGGVAGAKGSEAGFETVDQGLVALEQGRVGDALVLFKKAVFFEGEVVEFVADLEVRTEGVGHGKRDQGVVAAEAETGAGAEATAPGEIKREDCFTADSSQVRCLRRQVTMVLMSWRMAGGGGASAGREDNVVRMRS
jgi:hypothetical protein